MDGVDISIALCSDCETDRCVKQCDWANELGVREMCERRDPGVHPRLHRDLSGGRRSDEVKYLYGLTIFVDDKTEVAGFETDPNEESMWSMLKRLVRYLVDA